MVSIEKCLQNYIFTCKKQYVFIKVMSILEILNIMNS